jgi:hypothetical protein
MYINIQEGSTRKIYFGCLIFITLLFLGSCQTLVTFSKEFNKSSPVDSSNSYVFGKFTGTNRMPAAYLALVIQDIENNKEYIIRFYREERATILQVSPGRYSITRILALDELRGKVGEFKLPTSNNGLTTPFIIEPGELLYIGDFKGSVTNIDNYHVWKIDSIDDNFYLTLEELLQNRKDLSILKERNLLIE